MTGIVAQGFKADPDNVIKHIGLSL
jgi:hypothetical protein